MDKKWLVFFWAGAFLIGALTGCGKVQEQSSDAGNHRLKVGLVIAGRFGDRSFYDSAFRGIERAKKDLGVETRTYQCKQDADTYKKQLVLASEQNDVIVVAGFQLYDIVQDIAKGFPDKEYIYVDNIIEGIQNIASIDYLENEGSFLAGALAAMMTAYTGKDGINQDKVIGVIGGMDIPVIRNFIAGYEQGAKYVDPDVKVKVAFAGDFEDPARGRKQAIALYENDCDIIFQIAGRTGQGVLQAAKEAKGYVIGVNDGYPSAVPEYIVADMVKRVDLSIYESLKRIQDGSFQPGSVYRYGLREEGIGIVFNKNTKKTIPATFIRKIKQMQNDICDGKIMVEEYNG